MATNRLAGDIAVGLEWTPFSHGFVFWEYPSPEHLPPTDEAGQREWLEGFRQAHADYPDEPYDPDHPESGETAADALRRMLLGNPHLPALQTLLRAGADIETVWQENEQMRQINRIFSKTFLKYYRSTTPPEK